MESISVGDIRYDVAQTFVRTPGRINQRLYAKDDRARPKCCPSCQYHLAVRSHKLYWIKEPLQNYPGGIQYEGWQTKLVAGRLESQGGDIGAVEVWGWDDRYIVFEYLNGFTKLAQINDPKIRERIGLQILCWLDAKPVSCYDLSENNLMVRNGRVRLIDFAYSPDKSDSDRRKFVSRSLIGSLPW